MKALPLVIMGFIRCQWFLNDVIWHSSGFEDGFHTPHLLMQRTKVRSASDCTCRHIRDASAFSIWILVTLGSCWSSGLVSASKFCLRSRSILVSFCCLPFLAALFLCFSLCSRRPTLLESCYFLTVLSLFRVYFSPFHVFQSKIKMSPCFQKNSWPCFPNVFPWNMGAIAYSMIWPKLLNAWKGRLW